MNTHERKPWYLLSADEVLKAFNTTKDGLSDAEAAKRLAQYGRNALSQTQRKSIFKMLVAQLSDTMILILLAAAALSAFLNEWAEAWVILFIVAINALISIVQERKAQNALEALKNMNAPVARVMRQEEESVVPAADLVPGDIIFLEDGAIVPADVRLIYSANLKIQEASLTGESVPSEKDADDTFEREVPLGDRTNMAYMSSIVMYGSGIGVVVGTGMNTQVGKIADMLEEQEDDGFDTPIKRKLNSVGKTLSIVGIVVCVLIFAVGYLYGRPLVPLLMTAISLAISVIPEGLPATATIVMALGVQRMAKKNALMRNLPAVETLGSASVICSDKTGTLTQNKMSVVKIAADGDFEEGDCINVEEAVKNKNDKYRELLYAACLCNNATLNPDAAGEILGDPTEGALIFLAEKFGINQDDFEEKYPRLFEQPFDSDRKRMTTVHKIDGQIVAYTKGAVDEMLPLCTHITTPHGTRRITPEDVQDIREICMDMSEDALRVLGFAQKFLDKVPQEDEENVEFDMTFIGAVGMIDPPRKEVIPAIETCHKAGIRTIMITGDHKATAIAIARQLGIYNKDNTVLTGEDLDKMSPEELDKAVRKTTVFARVSPKDKLQIVNSLNRLNEVTAMTGDGVNDSPALKAASIGVAMGKTGTDVAKDSADMILLDDNFTTIEYAVREGRRVYRNIQKVIQFLLAGNIAEILTLFIATALNWNPPILAVHILLINLATDTLPALALGVDPVSKNIMKHKPVKTGTLFERGLIIRVILHGIYIAAATLAAYLYGLRTAGYPQAMTMAFCVLAISQMFHALNQRSNTESAFSKSEGHNVSLFVAMVASGLILACCLFIPTLESFFKLVDLTAAQWGYVAGFSLLPLVMVEITKFFKRRFKKD